MNSYSFKGQFLLESNLILDDKSLANLDVAFNLVQTNLYNFANSSDFQVKFDSVFDKKKQL